MPSAGSSAPASEWTAVSSSDSSAGSGRAGCPGSARRAGLAGALRPESSRWWPPAAATSTAYRASAMPEQVGQVELVQPLLAAPATAAGLPDIGATGGASGTSSPRSSATTWASERMPSTSCRAPSPPRRPAARARRRARAPRSAAASTIGSTPGTERRPPSRVSSPTNDGAVERRRAAPRRRRAEHRHRDREVEVGAALGQVGRREQDRDPPGGRPLEPAVDDRHPAPVAGLVERRRRPGRRAWCRPGPDETSAWTSMRWPTAPLSETVWVVANGISRAPARGRRSRRRVARPEHGDQVDAHVARAGRVRPRPTAPPAGAAGRSLAVGDRLVRRAAGVAACGS